MAHRASRTPRPGVGAGEPGPTQPGLGSSMPQFRPQRPRHRRARPASCPKPSRPTPRHEASNRGTQAAGLGWVRHARDVRGLPRPARPTVVGSPGEPNIPKQTGAPRVRPDLEDALGRDEYASGRREDLRWRGGPSRLMTGVARARPTTSTVSRPSSRGREDAGRRAGTALRPPTSRTTSAPTDPHRLPVAYARASRAGEVTSRRRSPSPGSREGGLGSLAWLRRSADAAAADLPRRARSTASPARGPSRDHGLGPGSDNRRGHAGGDAWTDPPCLGRARRQARRVCPAAGEMSPIKRTSGVRALQALAWACREAGPLIVADDLGGSIPQVLALPGGQAHPAGRPVRR